MKQSKESPQSKEPPSTILKVEGLGVKYSLSHQPESLIALQGVSFTMKEPGILGIIGPNGGGKTTLVKAILTLANYQSGNIEIFEQRVTPSLISKINIGYVPQIKELNWNFPLTVIEVALMGTYRKLGWLSRVGEREREIAREALREVDLLDLADRSIDELSGGQKQRAIIARAIAQDCDIFFLDEPFQGIDMSSEKTIFNLFNKKVAQGKSFVVVHHNVSQVKKYFQKCLLLNREVVDYGIPEKVLTEANITRAYLT